MKKILLVLFCLLLFNSTAFANEFSVNIDFAMASDIKYSYLGDSYVINNPGGLGIGASYFGQINEKVELGGGATFFFPRSLTRGSINGIPAIILGDANITYIPIYGRIRFSPRPDSKVKFYFGGDLRYGTVNASGSFFSGATVQGSLGYGLFGGIMIEEFNVELGYIMQNGTFSGGGYTSDFTDNHLYIKGGFSIL